MAVYPDFLQVAMLLLQLLQLCLSNCFAPFGILHTAKILTLQSLFNNQRKLESVSQQ